MDFALNLPLAKLLPDPARTAASVIGMMGRALEDAGLSACLTSEHPAPSSDWLRNDPAGHDCVDPLVALAVVAGATERLKLFTNVLVLPYRNPFLTAKGAATLQVMSDNRLLLGVGAGYMAEEFAALGVDFRARGKLMDEALETIRLTWAGGPVSVAGRDFDAVAVEPRPLPRPAPPLWVGGGSDAAVARAARLGDGWLPYFSVPTNDPVVRKSAVVSMDHFAEKVARLRDLRAQAALTGPFDLVVAPPFRPQAPGADAARRFLDEVAELAAHGVNWIWTSVPAPSLEAYLDTVAWFGEEIVAVWNRSRT